MTKETINEIRELLQLHSGDPVWASFPDHMVEFYARSYLSNTRYTHKEWYKQLQEIFVEDVILNEEVEGILLNKEDNEAGNVRNTDRKD